MKKLPLSAPNVRCHCIILDAVLAFLAACWLFLAFSWPALLAVVFLLLLLGFYSIQVFCSAILVDPVEKKVSLQGLQHRKDDVSGAASVYTRETALNGQTTRVIVVADGDGRELSVIPTLNNANKGCGCEAVARELAGTLGVEFCPTVPAYLYDKAARREQRRQDERERETRRRKEAGRRARGPAETPEQEADHAVNYDEMDDGED